MTRDEIRQGLNCSFEQWAERKGFKPKTVRNALTRWHSKKYDGYGYGPKGVTREILISLSKDLGKAVSPSIAHYFKQTEAN